MKIILLQRDIVWGDPARNIERLDEAFRSVAPTDLYVLPEMWSSGFATDPVGYAEETPGAALEYMIRKSAELDAAIAGSVAVHDPRGYHNRFYFVKPDGSFEKYDKHHLFTYSGEHHRYTAGGDRVTVEWRGVRFRLTVCYDLRFPGWCRNNDGYDVMLCVASWPEVRVEPWKALLRARAIENQCYVIAVNRVGDDPGNHYCGASMAIDAWGNIVAACTDDLECAADIELNMEALKEFREKFPVLGDRDL